MLSTGLMVFLGVALILAKLPRRLMLKALGHPLAIDLLVSTLTLVIHWGTFSGVMAATVAGLLTSLATSAARRLFGYIAGNRYYLGVINVHPEFVFVYSQVRKVGKKPVFRPVETMNNTSWQNARKRAGLPQVRVHDLKHTFGRRLRAAGVSFEDRQDLLGHKSGRITTHYSAAELSNLLEAAEKACRAGSRKSPALEAPKQEAAGGVSPNRLMCSEESGAPGRI
jgi:hypothetical protein